MRSALVGAGLPIPVVDLFAGPGGLCEGFSSLGRPEGKPRFRVKLSIEKDPVAHRTLQLRAFFRQFKHGEAPEAYYACLRRGGVLMDELFADYDAEAKTACSEALCAELGKMPTAKVRKLIGDALSGADPWVLIGGPPCQAYSNAGRSRNKGKVGYVAEKDPRQFLYVEYLQIIADHRPAVFVMENVAGLLSATLNNQSVFHRILEDLRYPAAALRREERSVAGRHRDRYRIYSLERPTGENGYELRDYVVHSELHGIPQARHRIILLGVRDDLTCLPPKTLPEIAPVPARDVLDGLPRLRSGLSRVQDDDDTWFKWIKSAMRESWAKTLKSNGQADVYACVADTVNTLTVPRKGRGAEFVDCEPRAVLQPDWFLDPRLRGASNHATRVHMPSDLHRYLYAACFAKVRPASPWLWDFPQELLPSHVNVSRALQGGYFADRFRVQLLSRPSTTITSHIAKDGHAYIHPDPSQCRTLTVREAARLQTFPDNYFFCGARTAQYTQVGNAVPPLMAREIARIVAALLR